LRRWRMDLLHTMLFCNARYVTNFLIYVEAFWWLLYPSIKRCLSKCVGWICWATTRSSKLRAWSLDQGRVAYVRYTQQPHLKTYVNHFCIIFLSFLCRFKIYFTDLVYWFIYLFYFFWIFILFYFIFVYFILLIYFILFIYFAELHSCFCHRCHSLQRRNFVDKSAISTE
jgi:hypothetical protein